MNRVSRIKCWWASEVKTNVKYGVKEGNRGSNEILGILRVCVLEWTSISADRFFFLRTFSEWLCFIVNCLFKYRFTRHFLIPNGRSLYQHSVKRTTICLFFESKITLYLNQRDCQTCVLATVQDSWSNNQQFYFCWC